MGGCKIRCHSAGNSTAIASRNERPTKTAYLMAFHGMEINVRIYAAIRRLRTLGATRATRNANSLNAPEERESAAIRTAITTAAARSSLCCVRRVAAAVLTVLI